jgi:hypothetical protein
VVTGRLKGTEKGFVKPTSQQLLRRRDKVVEYTIEGHSVGAIAEALDVTPYVVGTDRKASRHRLAGVKKHTWKTPRPPVPPAPYDWRGGREAAGAPAYKTMSPVRSVASMLKHLRDGNSLNRLAHNIDQASAAGDRQWLLKSRAALEDTAEYVVAMLALFDDEQARTDAAHSLAGRDDLRHRSRDESPMATVLPDKGTGVVPATIYGVLWRFHWAGIPVGDREVANISRWLKTRPGRVRSALAEMNEKVG